MDEYRNNLMCYQATMAVVQSTNFFFSPFFIKLVIGLILGIVAMVNGLGGFGMLIAGPITVFMLSFFAKIFG